MLPHALRLQSDTGVAVYGKVMVVVIVIEWWIGLDWIGYCLIHRKL